MYWSLILLVFLSICIFNTGNIEIKLALLISLIFIIVADLIRNKEDTCKKQFLVLHDNGKVSVGEQKELTMHLNSRIGWFGCWLTLIHVPQGIEPTPPKKTIDSLYIFKDQLSSRDYARLCRHILKTKLL